MARKAKVLVVGQEKHLTDQLTLDLNSDSCEVLDAGTVEVGAYFIAREDPDLVLVDAKAPGGLQLIRDIHTDPHSPPMLALTHSRLVRELLERGGVRTIDQSAVLDEIQRRIRCRLVPVPGTGDDLDYVAGLEGEGLSIDPLFGERQGTQPAL